VRKTTYERHITDTAPPKKGLGCEGAQLTKIRAGMLGFVCEVCGLPFERRAAKVKRQNTTFCSKACYYQSMRIVVEKTCVICGEMMSGTPSQMKAKSACSPECSLRWRIKRGKKGQINPGAFAIYRHRANEIKAKGVCEKCGVKNGPWVVRELTLVLPDTGMPYLIEDDVALWCKHCHLEDSAPLGPPARKWRPQTSNA
jgi:hypothetical protein